MLYLKRALSESWSLPFFSHFLWLCVRGRFLWVRWILAAEQGILPNGSRNSDSEKLAKKKIGSRKRSHKLLVVFLSCPYSAFSRKICRQRFIDFMIPYRLLQSKGQYLKQNCLYSELEHTTLLTIQAWTENRRRLRTNSQFVFWQLTRNAVSWTIIEPPGFIFVFF